MGGGEKLPWAEITAMVSSRDAYQCRQKFFNCGRFREKYLRMIGSGGSSNGDDDDDGGGNGYHGGDSLLESLNGGMAGYVNGESSGGDGGDGGDGGGGCCTEKKRRIRREWGVQEDRDMLNHILGLGCKDETEVPWGKLPGIELWSAKKARHRWMQLRSAISQPLDTLTFRECITAALQVLDTKPIKRGRPSSRMPLSVDVIDECVG